MPGQKMRTICLLSAFLALTACQSESQEESLAAATAVPQQSAEKPPERESSWTDKLDMLGVYVAAKDSVRLVEFKEFGRGATERVLRASDFGEVPTLGPDDFLILYGESMKGRSPNVFSYKREGETLSYAGVTNSLDAIFGMAPQAPRNGQPVVKLVPKASLSNGVYVLHYFVGMKGDAYLPIQIEGRR